MQEERVERGDQLVRAAGTGAFAGLVVPQYLTDLYAPGRGRPPAVRRRLPPARPAGAGHDGQPVADHHPDQHRPADRERRVSETDIDDTLMTINVQTNAGQQTLSRQAIERGAGVEPVVLDDLFRRYATTLDSTLLNQATNGLTNVATAVAYTDGTPTATEFYPQDASRAWPASRRRCSTRRPATTSRSCTRGAGTGCRTPCRRPGR
jgi:hypothetical protein